MEDWKVGFAFCGSFCTYDSAMAALEAVHRRWKDVTPIISERSAATDTRFGCAHDFMKEMQRICDKRPIDSIQAAEPIGHKKLLDVLVICPCTGNTLAKLAAGVTDSSVTMAAKAHLRTDVLGAARQAVVGGLWSLRWPPTTAWRAAPRTSVR